MRPALLLLALLALGGMAWIRLAPSDPARWNVRDGRFQEGRRIIAGPGRGDSVEQDADGARGISRLYPDTPAELLHRLDLVALSTPRTARLAGSPEAGLMTWITRSAIFGFPDYTTAEVRESDRGAAVLLFARQRFGRKDFGVNAARLGDWLARLGR
ncbi:DUF1499 domain-containing protein [Albidovulum sp.]|uniref:DUF1499 domain-containing protein n=1 Tax=Albidovulum sp. TaxID=1872424 RepID=UPI0035274E75